MLILPYITFNYDKYWKRFVVGIGKYRIQKNNSGIESWRHLFNILPPMRNIYCISSRYWFDENNELCTQYYIREIPTEQYVDDIGLAALMMQILFSRNQSFDLRRMTIRLEELNKSLSKRTHILK